MSLSTLEAACNSNLVFNTDNQAVEITYTYANGKNATVNALTRHRQRMEYDDRGGQRLVEELEVLLQRSDLDEAPSRGCSVTLADGERPYLYQFDVEVRPLTYRVNFQRRSVPSVSGSMR